MDSVTEEPIPVDNFDGYCIMTIWKKKSYNELQKLRDNSQGLSISRPDIDKKHEEKEYASNAPNQFDRKKYKYLSDKQF